MVELLGTYRINIRWIDDLESRPIFKTFDQKHKAYCKRLNITTCFWDLMYTRFGMAAELLKEEGYQRALFIDNDVGLYEDISFFTQYQEGWISAFDWTTQVALWNVETMESFFHWLMYYFDTEPAPVVEDPGDMLGARLFLRRHPKVPRRILCGPGESLLCGNGPVYQAMESIQHVNCDLVNQTACPLHDCGEQFGKMITWKLDKENRFIPMLNRDTQLPVIHFGDACEKAINTKMYPITLDGLQPTTDAKYR